MQTDIVQRFVVLLAGAAFVNAAFAAALWRSTRDRLFRSLFVAWTASIAAGLAQGAAVHGDLRITLGFSVTFFANAAFAHLLAATAEVPMRWRPLFAGFGLGIATSLVAAAAGAPFLAVALPTALAVAAPSVVVGLAVFRRRWATLHAQARALTLSCMVFSLHNLDFAFLRNRDSLVLVGFTAAFLVIFAMSISAPAALLEVVTKRQTRLAAQLEIARTLQVHLAPTDAHLENLEYACHMRQADSVGGDYLHRFRTGDTEWFFAVDVVGHGFHAGLLALMAHSALLSVLEARPGISPRELIHLVNRILCRNLKELEERRFMTIVSIRRERATGRLVVSGCHEDLLVYRAGARAVQTIPVAHFPLGVGFSPDLTLEQIADVTLELAPGDILFVGTDGVFEAARHGRYELGLFGADPVVEVLAGAGEAPLTEIRRRVVERLDAFTEERYGDDVAFFMLRATSRGPA